MKAGLIIKKVLIIVVGIIIFCLQDVYAQYYSLGQDPASTKWHQIKTDKFQVIYPVNFEKQAQHLANILEYVYEYATKTLNHKPKRISVILHTQTVSSNASVVWAPKRMEFYTCPSQDMYAQDWLEQLAIHEYRHVVQTDKLNQGVTKILYFLLGEQAAAIVLGLYVPLWFLEGDAVCTETALSNSGRGRLPSFERELRVQLLEKGKYNYDKAVFGSYKDFVTNYYKLGYHITANARRNYGADIWSNTLDKVARYPFMVIPFNSGIKKASGLSKEKLYNETMFQIDSLWKIQQNKQTYIKYNRITKDKKFYTDYTNMNYLNDSTILTDKSGIDDINRFVLVDKKGNEKKVFTPGLYFGETLSLANDIVCWSAKQYDMRWDNRSWAVIKTYNLQTKKLKQITRKSRYFAPILSGDAKRIVAVEVSEENKYNLVILDASTGEVLKKIDNPENYFLLTPNWSGDEKKIVVVLMNEKGKSIALIDVDNAKTEFLMPFTFTEIVTPAMFQNYVLFVGAYSGIDNIYALDVETKEIFQVTSSRFGIASPAVSPDGKHIIYSDYTSKGFDIVEIDFNPDSWLPLEKITDNSIKLYEAISKQESFVLNSKDVPNKEHITKKYRKGQHLFNFHSWAPVSIDIDNISMNPGVTVMSQNKLSTMFTIFGYDYDRNEEAGTHYADVSYRAWYPVIDGRIEYGKRDANYISDDKKDTIPYYWDQINTSVGIRLPLSFTRNKYYRGIQPQVRMNFLRYDYDTARSPRLNFGGEDVLKLNIITYRLFGYNQLKTSEKDMYPKWGQTIDFIYNYNPLDKQDTSSIISLEATLYFPGLFKHHGLKIYGGIQNKQIEGYHFLDIVNYPRGYVKQNNDEIKSVSVNYKFPLLYPDKRLGSLVYLKRIKSNLFYDYAEASIDSTHTFYRSMGVELTSDMHLLRFLAPFDIGVRSIYMPSINDVRFELLFAVRFDGF